MPSNRDIPGLDFGLGEEIDMLRETVRGFSDAKVAPIAAEIDRSDEFPRHLWPEMGALGLHGITVEEDYGGTGMGYVAHCVAMEEVSRASASKSVSSVTTAKPACRASTAVSASYRPPVATGGQSARPCARKLKVKPS